MKSKKDNHDTAFTAGLMGGGVGKVEWAVGPGNPRKMLSVLIVIRRGMQWQIVGHQVVVLRERDHKDRRARRPQLRQVLRLRQTGFRWWMARQMLLGMVWRDFQVVYIELNMAGSMTQPPVHSLGWLPLRNYVHF